jgi:hypothetical protein
MVEFVACFEAMVQGLWLWKFIAELKVANSTSRPLTIYCDNSAVVFYNKNDKYSKGAKHMKIKYLLVKDKVKKQTISIQHISTSLMIADPLTK